MLNRNYIFGSLACLFVGLVGGYLICSMKAMNPQIYHANTVGSQIIQINEIYEKFTKNGESTSNDIMRYNRDILTVIDCSQLLKSISGMEGNSDLKPFRDGLSKAWEILVASGMDKSGLNLCDGAVLSWIEGARN